MKACFARTHPQAQPWRWHGHSSACLARSPCGAACLPNSVPFGTTRQRTRVAPHCHTACQYLCCSPHPHRLSYKHACVPPRLVRAYPVIGTLGSPRRHMWPRCPAPYTMYACSGESTNTAAETIQSPPRSRSQACQRLPCMDQETGSARGLRLSLSTDRHGCEGMAPATQR